MYPPSSRIFTSSATLSFKLPSGTRFRFASSTSWARCFRRRSTASRPIFSSMNRRAQSVMCVYASGKRPVDPRLRAKKARGRPRPAARKDRSTRPFPSRTVRCFNVAIFEMRRDAARSVRETAPCRFKVRRICFLEDEKPVSRPPSSTSGIEAMASPSTRDIIYLCVYKIDGEGIGLRATELEDAGPIRSLAEGAAPRAFGAGSGGRRSRERRPRPRRRPRWRR